MGAARASNARKADYMRKEITGADCILIANSSGRGIAGTLDGSYFKGQGLRQGIEREYIVCETHRNDKRPYHAED